MKRLLWTAMASLGLWALAGQTAEAQFSRGRIGSYQRPFTPRQTVSPYINLRRGVTGYYGITRPNIQSSLQLQQLQQEVSLLGGGGIQPQFGVPGSGNNQPVTTTGHPVTFFNYSHYYPGFTGGGVGGVGGASGGFGNPATDSSFAPFGGVNPNISTTGIITR